MKLTAKTAGKINTLLDLTGTLDNGYHCIYTVMQSVGVFDTVSAEQTTDGEITLACDRDFIPTDRSNTAYKAAELFFLRSGIKNPGLKIEIQKNIPCGAGMGGGSADAAAVLALLNKMYSFPFGEDELLSLGVQIGADVPFCIKGGCALCLNIGEIMAPLPVITELTAVIVKPGQCVSTKEAYAAFDSLGEVRHPDNNRFLFAAAHADSSGIFRYGANVFEQAVEVCGRAVIKSAMKSCGAGLAMMTGSGSAVFGLFTERGEAEKCASVLSRDFDEVHTAEFLNKSIFIQDE